MLERFGVASTSILLLCSSCSPINGDEAPYDHHMRNPFCSSDQRGLQFGICSEDQFIIQTLSKVDQTPHYTELQVLVAKLKSEGSLIEVYSEDSDNGSFKVSEVVGKAAARATIGRREGKVIGSRGENFAKPVLIPMTPEHLLVHEILGHGVDWANLSIQDYLALSDKPIGQNPDGLAPTVVEKELTAIKAENRYRAAKGSEDKRTHYYGAVVTP